MDPPRHIHDLADELLSEILTFLLADARTTSGKISENGHYLAVGTDATAIGFGEASDLDRFRLVCQRFMRIGTPRKFSRFTLRFSEDGFQRLEELLDMQLACYVRTVTYMVRPFYQGSGCARILRMLGSENPTLSQLHARRIQEQNTLVESGYDLSRLRLAIAAFSSLQEIKLLRLQDEADESLIDFIRDHALDGPMWFDWESACSRAVTNLGIALLDSQCSSIRFIGPQISPEATLQLLRAPSNTLAAMGGRLTSLDINFHSTTNITATMADLSGVFHRFFMAAKNLIAIHIGFPSKMPLDLKLERLFHDVRWKTLRTLSIQGWRLDADEIIALVRRHRRQLRVFRLVGVYLRAGRWRDVLSVLREEMEQLERLDLREIDYSAHFDTVVIASGVEVFETPPTGPLPYPLTVAAGTSPPLSQSAPAVGPDGTPALFQGRRTPLKGTPTQKLRGMSLDDLGDNGAYVQRDQARLWEAWVLSGPQRDMHNGHTPR